MYPRVNKWLQQCIICQTEGYKPDMPEDIYPGVLAHNIRALWFSLAVDALGVCEDCGEHLKS